VLLGEVDVNGLANEPPVRPLGHGRVGEKMLAMHGIFFYNEQCVLLFEQVPKREGGEGRISQVMRL
jgi:hypothetical protein